MKIEKKARKTLQNKEIFYEILFTSGKLGKAVCGVVLRILCECALAGRMYLFTSARPAAAQ